MDRWDRIYEWQMVLVGVVGVVLTALFVEPGQYTVRTGVVGFDPLYALLALFSAVALWSVVALRRARRGS